MSLFQIKNFLLLTTLLTPLYLIKVQFFNFPTNLLEIMVFTSIVVFLFKHKMLFFQDAKKIPRSFLFSISILFLGVMLSTFFNDNKLTELGIIKGWFLLPIIFSLIIFSSINSLKEIERIFLVIFFSTSTVALISLIYKALNIVTYDNRLCAFYLSPNHLAMYVASGIPFGLYFLLKNRENLAISFLFLISVLSLYFTFSYGAWIASLVSILIMILTSKSKEKNYLYLLGLASFLFVSMISLQIDSEKLQDLISFTERSSASSRMTIWQVSLKLISENPILGIGPGNFQTSYLSLQKLFPPYLEWAVPQPHNLFLAFWLQTGLIGLIGFVSLLILIFKKLFYFRKNKKDAALATPLIGFFVYTILHGMIDTTYWKNDLSYLFWIALILTIITTCENNFRDQKINENVPH